MKKKVKKCKHNNYRPVSMFPSFSKIIEKVFAIKLIDYFIKFSLFTKTQYGFRPTYSLDIAVNNICQSIYDVLDSKVLKLLYSVT